MSSYRYHCTSKQHLKKLNEIRQSLQTIQTKPITIDINLICKECNKSFCNVGNANRHKKNCSKNNITNKLPQPSNPTNITINIQQNITNNTANIVNNIEITPDGFFDNFWKQAEIRPMGFEDLSGLDSQEIADKIHGFGLNCFVEFLNQVYKNEVNHNIALFNKREKLVKYIHKSGEIKIDSLVSVMSAILMNMIDYLDTYLERTDITIKPQFLAIIQKLKEIHLLDVNPNLERYNTHLYNRLLNITTSSLKKMKNYDTKTAVELSDSLKKITLAIPRTDSRTEPDILAIS